MKNWNKFFENKLQSLCPNGAGEKVLKSYPKFNQLSNDMLYVWVLLLSSAQSVATDTDFFK